MGDSGPALEGLSRMFSDPEAYGVLPYKNIDTEEIKNALENLTEEQKLQINQMLKDLKK